MTVVEFLEARVAEDELTATAAVKGKSKAGSFQSDLKPHGWSTEAGPEYSIHIHNPFPGPGYFKDQNI